MIVGTLTPNGLINAKVVDQSKLTPDCWLIQFNGLEACKSCPCMGKDGKRKKRGENACGGGKTLIQLLEKESSK